jgi:hypothetical protein
VIPENAIRVEIGEGKSYDWNIMVDVGRVMCGWRPKYYDVARKDENGKEVYWLWNDQGN